MKTLSILSILALASVAQAAPAISSADISEDALKAIGTERQQKSIDAYNEARRRAEKKRDEDAKEIKEITKRNDNGLKKTIQRRHLNTMLPPCEREPETPREPADYTIRPE